jgi:polysaccharide biosynthesis protein PslG
MGKLWRVWVVTGAIVLGGGLLLDLTNQGLVWRAVYNLTGEESVGGQGVGALEWPGRWLRPQPETAPYTPVDHAGVSPFGINVFLEQEAEVIKREQTLQMIAEAGFVWLRQEFPWEDIEIHQRGDFQDRRNDRNQDGVIDEADYISAWEKYDNIVDLVEKYDLRLMVRLSNPPDWTHADEDAGDKGPPDNLQDYVNFAATVAERYQGRITHYQVWNEPNIYPEWGNRDVNPAAYVEMLCRTYDALKAVDEDIVVISGALAPTVSMNYRDLNDFIYLQLMLEAGAGDCFDVMSVQGYGLNSGPTDRRLRPTAITFSRLLYIRDMLVQYGYADKAIWISEAAWNPVPPDKPDIAAREAYGVVTTDQAARYMVGAYERQQQEWPFTGVMFYWFFKRAADTEQNQSWYYFRMTDRKSVV